MWDDHVFARSTDMSLGDGGPTQGWNGVLIWPFFQNPTDGALSVLATYACDTLVLDGDTWNRWHPVFSGGLKYSVGSWKKLMSGWTTSEVGEEFAKQLQQGKVIKTAWVNAVSDWWVDQYPAAMASGTTCSEAENRLNNMKWSNYKSYSYIRNGIGCLSLQKWSK